MDDGVPIRFNGIERDRSVIVIGHCGAAYSSVERTARQTPEVRDRGWPETGPSFKIFETSETAQCRLRVLVLEVLASSPQLADGLGIASAAAAIKESLLAAIDTAFAHVVPAQWASRANVSRQFKVFRDVQAVLSSDVGHPSTAGTSPGRLVFRYGLCMTPFNGIGG